MNSFILIPPIVWPLAFLLGTFVAYAELTQARRIYKTLWTLAAATALIIGWSL